MLATSLSNIHKLAKRNPKAVNEMCATVASGIHAGNEGMTPQKAADVAVETVERILSLVGTGEEEEEAEDSDSVWNVD